jgi:hypothetical protein
MLRMESVACMRSDTQWTVRQRLDRAIRRALFDYAYASELLHSPASVLDTAELDGIRAESLQELARHLRQLLWMFGASGSVSEAAAGGD